MNNAAWMLVLLTLVTLTAVFCYRQGKRDGYEDGRLSNDFKRAELTRDEIDALWGKRDYEP